MRLKFQELILLNIHNTKLLLKQNNNRKTNTFSWETHGESSHKSKNEKNMG